MDFKFLYHRIKYIILNPAKAWNYIFEENRPLKDPRNSFLFPLVILITLSAFLGSIIFTNATLSPVYSVFIALKYLILNLFVVYASAVVFSEITKALDLGKDFTVSFKMMVYSLAPFFICQIVSNLFESLIFVDILALYGLYIFWVGAVKMLNPPEHKKMPMLVATFIVITGFFISGSIVLSAIIDRFFFKYFAQ
jgi:hypothetical protein